MKKAKRINIKICKSRDQDSGLSYTELNSKYGYLHYVHTKCNDSFFHKMDGAHQDFSDLASAIIDIERDKKVFCIIRLGVYQKHRGKNYGTLLIDKAKKICADLSIGRMYVLPDQSNTSSEFYKKNGFVDGPESTMFLQIQDDA